MTQKKGKSSARPRSAARLAAVQALYDWELSGAAVTPLLEDFVQQRLGGKAMIANEDESEEEHTLVKPDLLLFTGIVRGTIDNLAQIDAMLTGSLAAEWPVERLESVLKAIMRAGGYELFYMPETPAKVVISEYIDVAHAFYSGPEPKMVNAVLDRIAQTVRADETGRNASS